MTRVNAFSALAMSDMPNGVAIRRASVALAAQAANIGSTVLWAVTSTGFYHICTSIKRTQIATTSSTLPSVTLGWTDGDNSQTGTTTAVATNATNTLVATLPAQTVVYAKTGTNITYSTSGYASSGATPMQYALELNCEAL